MDTVGETSFDALAERELEVTRTFEAPREVVWEAWTTCEHVPAWSGPAGWELASCEMDVRPGGTYRFVFKGPGDLDVPSAGAYLEVVEPERLVTTQAYDGVNEITNTLELAEEGGRTRMSYRVEYPSAEIRDAALAPNMKEGMALGYGANAFTCLRPFSLLPRGMVPAPCRTVKTRRRGVAVGF
jgi:uncharacterized protein YndB with AHSA1/START domain